MRLGDRAPAEGHIPPGCAPQRGGGRLADRAGHAGLAASARFRVRGELTTRSATVFRRGKSDNRLGIYMLGACDLPTVFAAKPFIEQDLDGVCAIMRDGEVADADFLLQRSTVLTPARWQRRANTSSCPPTPSSPVCSSQSSRSQLLLRSAASPRQWLCSPLLPT